MLQENRFRSLASGLALTAALTMGAISIYGQPAAMQSTASQSEAPTITPSAKDANSQKWSDEQLITSTVSQAWRLSGRNENTFFDMVQQLAAISARNRGLVLPNTAAAGQKAGEYIKRMAKADHQQLLYEIVDKAVQKVGTPAPATAAK